MEIFGFTDASYITVGNSKSRLCGCVYTGYNTGAIYSFSVNDNTVSHSSFEAEIKLFHFTNKTSLTTRTCARL